MCIRDRVVEVRELEMASDTLHGKSQGNRITHREPRDSDGEAPETLLFLPRDLVAIPIEAEFPESLRIKHVDQLSRPRVENPTSDVSRRPPIQMLLNQGFEHWLTLRRR